ncbi:MAG: hypothetical protein Q9224_001488 [Gallowayella concinna]
MVNPSADSQFSRRPSSDTSPSSDIAPQRAACERCRGQKLRCTRTCDSRAACNRCERAGAQCIVNPALRTGRPIRLEPSFSQQKSPNEHPDRSGTSSVPNELPPQITEPFDDVCLPLSAVSAPSPPVPMDSAQQICMNSYEGLVQDQDHYGAELFGMVSLFGEEAEGTFGGCPPSPRSMELLKASSESYMTCINLQNGAHTRPLDPTSTTGHQDPFQLEPTSAQNPASTKTRLGVPGSTDICEVPLEQLSRLNLEFYRYWSRSKIMAVSTQGSDSTLNGSSSPDLDSLLPISLLIHGLHKFQDLVQECSAFANSHISTRHAQARATVTGLETCSGLDDDIRPPKRPRTRCSTTLGTSRSCRSFETPGSPCSMTTWMQSPATSLSDASHPYAGPRTLAKTHDRGHLAHSLDMPTRMLLVTCYVNLTRFCRRVFHNIRRCLLTLDQETILSRLPDLVVGGVSLQQDGPLQILVLIQIVSGMMDAISTGLGYPKEYRILTGSFQCGDTSSRVSEKSPTPNLMELVMKEEEMCKAQDASGGGIKALQEEIRELKKIVQ